MIKKKTRESRVRHMMAGALVAISLVASPSGWATDRSSLFEEILAADQTFFTAFNRCDTDTMGEMFARDLEFFHDLAGVSDYEQTMAAGIENCERELGLVRTLDVDSMSVYPIKDYGAIQEAEHTFCHMENGKNDCGTFKFVHIWRRSNDGWQMTRVISYGHQPGKSESAPADD